ncbi:type III PLP-dependent enzyme [Herbaspirillum robiniae]|uniref:Siderophore biosynthesis PLP-dependent protein n=1 Tax=Herbaspirillum robiniae TaxID=2014887 RepID=A0A246WS06_9BURK|nr:type III PLP-dependent enzyme [Herbaspirillum robiniae]OWY29126.1 siderophore biosynthesis PLP-dependent protein [Herbaspirillum robiniae]
MREQLISDYLRSMPSPACAYLYDLRHLQERSQRLRGALPPQCKLFYAIKANSDAPILDTLRHNLDGFEVASLGEIEKVRATDHKTPIVFGGPGKTDAELEGALKHSVMLIHVESEHQLRRLNWIAGRRRQAARVLLRLNPAALPGETRATLRMGGQATQFGIDEAQMPEMIALSQNLPNIRLEGLHIHALSNNLDAADHLALVRHYLELAQAWERRYGIRFSWLNAGGGIGINYADPATQFAWDGFCEGLHALLEQYRPGFKLIFECGRYISADCGCYVAEVIDIKTTHGKNFAILRGGSHHFRLPSSWQHNHPFTVFDRESWHYPFPRPGLTDADVTVCGELCTPKDTLARDVRVARLRAGDCLVFSLAGAYGWHISHHDFLSHPHPDRRYFNG